MINIEYLKGRKKNKGFCKNKRVVVTFKQGSFEEVQEFKSIADFANWLSFNQIYKNAKTARFCIYNAQRQNKPLLGGALDFKIYDV